MSRRAARLVPTFLASACWLAAGCKPPAQAPVQGPPAVTVAHPIVEKITLYTDLTGTVDQKDAVDVRPRVTGYIKEMKFKEGQEVAKDQVLFTIDPVIYQALLKQSEGQVKNYDAQLAKANADLARTQETFNRGATAKTELDQTVAAKSVAEAQLLTAQASVTRPGRTWRGRRSAPPSPAGPAART